MPIRTTEAGPESKGVTLLSQVTCPHCWKRFAPETILWISEHEELLGDPKLSDAHQSRFLPSRFTTGGDAIDPRGLVCTQLACPNCHLPVPRVLLEQEPLFISILGTPSSGKSFFLASMTWQLRSMLSKYYGLSFTDVDTSSNQYILNAEEALFLNPKAHELIPLGDLIEKTQLQGEQYNKVTYGRLEVSYPRPLLFSVRPRSSHPKAAKIEQYSRVLCVYDNAGEHFQPDQDSTSSPVTRHLARSRLLYFIFDPTQDPRFRRHCRRGGIGNRAQSAQSARQETVLNEAAARVRRFAGLSAHDRHQHPLIVVLSKSDEWDHLLGWSRPPEPPPDPLVPLSQNRWALHLSQVQDYSKTVRRLLEETCPEIITAAEDFASEVTYIPVSALGDHVEPDPSTKLASIRPEQIKPHWVTVPMVYGLSKVLPGLFPTLANSN